MRLLLIVLIATLVACGGGSSMGETGSYANAVEAFKLTYEGLSSGDKTDLLNFLNSL